jgi:5-(carboxyamino)imidazole ribonucleotide synthase
MRQLAPGSTIGILGGGQLGRMLALAAARLGFDAHVFTPEQDSPAARVAARATVAGYDDSDSLRRFAQQVDVVTAEFENVPAQALADIEAAHVRVRPDARAAGLMQDRISEKEFFASLGIATTPFAAVETRAEFDAAMPAIGVPAIVKTRRLGYDGKGQARIERLEDCDAAFAAMGGQPAILEGFCAFEREVSIICARGVDGAFAAYDLCENEHEHGVLRRTTAPAACNSVTEAQARVMAQSVTEALDYVGVLAIEFFQMPDGVLIANEMAPRVHNSGHWTLDACPCDQFEQHIRAIAGWPLGPVSRLADAEMINLVGEEAAGWDKLAGEPGARLHLYGKAEARAGRKMGHVTRLKPRANS